MDKQLKYWFDKLKADSIFVGDDAVTHIRGLLNTVLLTIGLLLVLLTAVLYAFRLLDSTDYVILGATFVFLLFIYGLNKWKHTYVANVLFAIGAWILLTATMVLSGGIANPGYGGYIFIILIAGLVLGRKIGLALALASIIVSAGLTYIESLGLLPPKLLTYDSMQSLLAIYIFYILLTGVVLYITTRDIQAALTQAQHSADALAQKNRELQKEVTEREQAERALRESEARYRTLVEHAPEALLVYSADKEQFVDVNENAVELFQMDLETLLQQTPTSVSPPQQPNGRSSREMMREKVEETLRGETPIFEWTHRNAKGEDIPCEVRFVRLPSSGETLIRGSVLDISERKAAETRIQEEQQRLQQIIAAIPGNVIITRRDGSGRIMWANQQALDFLGVTLNEMVGASIAEFYANPVDREALIAEVRRQGRVRNRVILFRDTTGRTFWGRASIEPLQYNETPALLGIMEDIDKLKKAEDALRESESRFRALVEATFEGVAISVNGRIVEANEAFARMFGYDREETNGLEPADIIAPESLDRALRHIHEGLETPYEAVGLRRDGARFPLELVGKNSVYQGQPARISGFRDITERKQAEDTLRQAQKLESLGLMAGGIAHDFNNLLVAMLGQTSVALVKLPNDNAARRHIEKAASAAERAAALTRQMLAYSGRSRFEIQSLDLNQLIEENLHLFTVAIPKNVTLHSDLAPSLPLVGVDGGQMQQVIMNLILNAAEAIGEASGAVTVTTSATTITAERAVHWSGMNQPLSPGRYVQLQVQDDGGGMDAETQSKIFDPFFTTKTTGRGLGLAAVLGIVRGHQGSIRVESEIGVGSTFQVLLPIATEPAETETETAVADTTPPQGLILIIDDEAPVREAVSDILTMGGLEAITAPDGETGIRQYQEHQERIRLVLLDLSMPGLSGAETCRRLHELDPDARIILTSGYTEGEATTAFAEGSYVGFIQKPYDFESLRSHIRRHLERSL